MIVTLFYEQEVLRNTKKRYDFPFNLALTTGLE